MYDLFAGNFRRHALSFLQHLSRTVHGLSWNGISAAWTEYRSLIRYHGHKVSTPAIILRNRKANDSTTKLAMNGTVCPYKYCNQQEGTIIN